MPPLDHAPEPLADASDGATRAAVVTSTRGDAAWFWIALLGVLAFAAWAWRDLLDVSFTGEDLGLIQQQARGFETMPTVFRPLWHAWFWCGERVFGGADPLPWHMAQLALHLVNAALVALVARALQLAPLSALTAAALFALGPGVADSVCWIAATNRELSGFGALVCVLGLLRVDCACVARRRAWALVALGGLLFQFGSNEEVYGTALLAAAWLAASALRLGRAREPRLLLAALVPLALLAVHFAFLRGSGGGYLTRDGRLIELVFVEAPRNALERLRELAHGWCAGADEYDLLALVVFGASLSWMKHERRRACIAIGTLLASFVPFALESGSRYRDYPTQAPAALCIALLVDSLLLFAPREPRSTRAVPAVIALLVACAAGWRERGAALLAWRDATAELEACRVPLHELAARAGARAPVLVNLELGTRPLLYAFDGIDRAALERHAALAFLDTPHACVAPPELDALVAGAAPLWGRRANGTFGAIDAAELAARPRVDAWKLYADVRACASLADARARLASGEIDPRSVALIEATLGDAQADAATRDATLPDGALPGDAVAARALEPGEHVRVARPLVLDAQRLQATVELEVACGAERWLVAQPPFLYSEALRFGPEYTRLGRVADPRVVQLEAALDGAPLAHVRAQAFGFALRVPRGTHRVALRFMVQPAQLLAR